MLSIKTRQTYLKYLGYYTGAIDGIEGKNTKAGYLKLQKAYFPKREQDGLYGSKTDTLLINAYNVKKYCKNFKLTEFRCGCGGTNCTGYPAVLNTNLLTYIQKVRDKYGSTTITSGLRCTAYNKKCKGATNSKHKSGKAIDFYNYNGTSTFAKRKATVNWYITSFPYASYSYCYQYGRTKSYTYSGNNSMVNYPSMGNAVHIDVK